MSCSLEQPWTPAWTMDPGYCQQGITIFQAACHLTESTLYWPPRLAMVSCHLRQQFNVISIKILHDCSAYMGLSYCGNTFSSLFSYSLRKEGDKWENIWVHHNVLLLILKAFSIYLFSPFGFLEGRK